MLPTVTTLAGAHYHAQLFCTEVSQTFLRFYTQVAWNPIFLIPASCIAWDDRLAPPQQAMG
jgi:hypothetical protein